MHIKPLYIKLDIFSFVLCIKDHLDFLQDDCCSVQNENQSRIFKVASYCSTEHLVHVILACVRQNLLPLVFDRRHMVGALKWSRRTFLPVHGILVNTRNSLSKSSAPPLHRRPCSIPWCSNRNESCEHSSKAHCFSRV